MMHRWFVFVMVAVASYVIGRWSRPGLEEARRSSHEIKHERLGADSREPEAHTFPTKASRRPATSGKPVSAAMIAPFHPGEAEEWLRLQIKHGGWNDDPAKFFRMLQSYSTMDEASIAEVVATLQKLIHRRQSASPAELADFPKEWLFRFGIVPALFRYSQLNPDAALDLIAADPVLRDEGVGQVALANMTVLNPDRALARVQGLEGQELRQAMEPILGTLFSSDPDRVIQILEDHPEEIFDGERRKVAERLAAGDPQRAIEFAVNAIRNGRNPDVLPAAVDAWRKRHPEEAERWVEKYTGPGYESLR